MNAQLPCLYKIVSLMNKIGLKKFLKFLKIKTGEISKYEWNIDYR